MREHTFGTTFVDVSPELAQALLAHVEAHEVRRGQLHFVGPPLTEEQGAHVHHLEQQLSTALGPHGGFCKLSSRSPKDAVYDVRNERTITLLDPLLKQVWDTVSPEDDLMTNNAEVAAFYSAANRAMLCSCGKDALTLFAQSLRIKQDLRRALRRHQEATKDQAWNVNIVVREWVEIALEDEFRGFVYQGRLVAVSQYYHFLAFDHLLQAQDMVMESIEAFFDTVHDRIPFHSYIMDFAVTGWRVAPESEALQSRQVKTWCIELNPWGKHTGACNFDWVRDSTILEPNDPPDHPVVRLTQAPWPNAKQRYMVPVWDGYIDEARAAYRAHDGGKCCLC